MRYSTLSAGLVVSFQAYLAIGAAVSKPVDLFTNPKNTYLYPLVPMDFTASDGRTAQGTIEEVAKKLNIPLPSKTLDTRDDKPTLVVRNKIQPPICTPQGGEANIFITRDNINYLRTIGGGQARCGVNARSCARISCSYNSQIALCNDGPNHIDPSCAYLAGYAQDILDRCSIPSRNAVKGQEFDTDQYNIIVKSDSC